MTEGEKFWSVKKKSVKIVKKEYSKKTRKTKQSADSKKMFFYVIAVGRVPGVYDTWAETDKQVNSVTNLDCKCATRKEAQSFVDIKGDCKSDSASANTQDSDDTEEAPQTIVAPGLTTTGTTYLEFPPDADIVATELAGQKRVFACQIDDNTARIAMTFDKSISGVHNPSVHVVNSQSKFLDNLVAAELSLQ